MKLDIDVMASKRASCRTKTTDQGWVGKPPAKRLARGSAPLSRSRNGSCRAVSRARRPGSSVSATDIAHGGQSPVRISASPVKAVRCATADGSRTPPGPAGAAARDGCHGSRPGGDSHKQYDGPRGSGGPRRRTCLSSDRWRGGRRGGVCQALLRPESRGGVEWVGVSVTGFLGRPLHGCGPPPDLNGP